MEAEFKYAEGVAQLTHDGNRYQADLSEPEPDIFIVVFNNRVYRCAVEKLPDGTTEVIVNGKSFPVTVRDKKHFHGKTGSAGASGGVMLSSPMPGKVVRVLLNAGEAVAAHQGVLVVEAMKMQNEVQSPRAGKVIEVKVSEGQTVNAGEVLAVVE